MDGSVNLEAALALRDLMGFPQDLRHRVGMQQDSVVGSALHYSLVGGTWMGPYLSFSAVEKDKLAAPDVDTALRWLMECGYILYADYFPSGKYAQYIVASIDNKLFFVSRDASEVVCAAAHHYKHQTAS